MIILCNSQELNLNNHQHRGEPILPDNDLNLVVTVANVCVCPAGFQVLLSSFVDEAYLVTHISLFRFLAQHSFL